MGERAADETEQGRPPRAPPAKKGESRARPTLSLKEQTFVDVYEGEGHGAEACRIAGYRGSVQSLSTQARRLLDRPSVRAALEKRNANVVGPHIMSRLERQALWSKVAMDSAADMGHRLRASELLGKSEADFTEKVQHSAAASLEQLILESFGPKG